MASKSAWLITPPTAYAVRTISHHGASRSTNARPSCAATSNVQTYFVREQGPYSSLISGCRRNSSRRRSACGSSALDQLKPSGMARMVAQLVNAEQWQQHLTKHDSIWG